MGVCEGICVELSGGTFGIVAIELQRKHLQRIVFIDEDRK